MADQRLARHFQWKGKGTNLKHHTLNTYIYINKTIHLIKVKYLFMTNLTVMFRYKLDTDHGLKCVEWLRI